MSGNRFLLDTNIILYLLNGDQTLADILQEKQVFVSFITEIELYGFKALSEEEKSKITRVLSSCTIVDLNSGIKSKTIEVRQSYNLKLPDSFIAGTALYFDMPLISADKGFNKIEELNLLSYEQ